MQEKGSSGMQVQTNSSSLRVLLLGESAGSARYLLGTFARAGYSVTHIEGRERVARVKEPYDVMLFSDYPAAHFDHTAMGDVVRAVAHGTGLIMVGGWTSFTGMGNGYRGTPIEQLLPVRCAESDDRRNVSSGLWFEAVQPDHAIVHGLDIAHPPVVCGYNAVELAPGASLIAVARHVAWNHGQPAAGAAVPLLAVTDGSAGRTVAFATDLIPHWCGGIVDWGTERVSLPSGAEVGDGYCTFLENLLNWAARRR